MSSNAAGSGCTSPGGSCNATPAFGQLSEQLQRLLRALLHQINHAAIFHIRQDGGVAVPLADGLLIRSAHPSGRLWRSISATLRFVKAEESGRLKLTPPQTALHSPAHHPIGRVLHDPGQTGAPRTVRHCWSRAMTCASKLRVKRPRGAAQGTRAVTVRPLLTVRRGTWAVMMVSNWQVFRCRQERSYLKGICFSRMASWAGPGPGERGAGKAQMRAPTLFSVALKASAPPRGRTAAAALRPAGPGRAPRRLPASHRRPGPRARRGPPAIGLGRR